MSGTDLQISGLVIYVRLRHFPVKKRTIGRSTTKVRPGRIKHLHTITLTLSDLSRTAQRMTYVRHDEPPLLQAVGGKRSTKDRKGL